MAFGRDLNDKVAIAYAHLMDVCEPDDRIFLFGFSRGAYTARVLAGMLHAVGLLPRGNTQLIPYAMRLYGAQPRGAQTPAWELFDGFRASFARDVPGAADKRFPVHFLGLWDTVSSVGWAWEPARYPYTASNPSVVITRHAVSLDERRWFFRQNLVHAEPGQDVSEVWFPGVHSDVGGGYPEAQGGLWRVPFEWMITHAQDAGMLFDDQLLATVRDRSPAPAEPWREPQHESLEGFWWHLAEVVPKWVYNPTAGRRAPKFGLGQHRYVHAGAVLDSSILERLRNTPYNPPNLAPAFVRKVKAMKAVTGPPAYDPGNSA